MIHAQETPNPKPYSVERQIKQWIDLLADEQERGVAIERLAGIGDSVIPFLMENFPEKNYKIKREIVTILSKIASSEAKKGLFVCMQDKDYGVRNRASVNLIELCNKDANLVEQIRALASSDPEIQKAIETLRKTIFYKKVEEELTLLISPQGGFGFYEGQFKHLLPLGEDAIEPLLEMFIEESYPFVNMELEKDEEIVYKIRYLAGEAIGDFKDHLGNKKAKTIKALTSMADRAGKDDQLKEIAMTSLYLIGEKSYMERRIHYWKTRIASDPLNEESYSQIGLLYLRIRREQEGVAMLKRAVEINPHYSLAYYNLACGYSCLGQIDKALDAIENAVEKGYDDVLWMKKDGDLRNIRNTARFKELIKKLEARVGGN